MSDAPAGVIVGGWPFVIGAYSITAAALALTILRLAALGRKAGQEAGDE